MNPSDLLVEYLPRLPKGRALDVAMGKGRNALYLAEQGWAVDGVERDEESVRIAKDEARRRGVSLGITVADLEQYRLSKDTYDVVTCFYYLQRDLIPQMREALKLGGVVLYETFLIDQHLKTGKPSRKEFCFGQNELLRAFSDLRVLYYWEGFISDDKAIARLVAQKIA
jgi:SAM-dependent methyltransferase